MTAAPLKRIFFIFCLLLLTCSHLTGSEHAELSKLRMENRRLRLELDRLRSKLSEKENDLQKFRLWLAVTADAGKMQTVSERERQLINILKETVKRSNRLLVHISGVDILFRDLLKELPVGPARQARLLLQLEQLERYALQLSTIVGVFEDSTSRPLLENIRAVAVNRQLDTVVLSAGSVHGVFPGLLFQSRQDSRLRLRIISVRPWVSAAVPVSCSADQFTPGMEFTIAHRANHGEGIQPLHTK
jgi:cell shape-determining protein MreC